MALCAALVTSCSDEAATKGRAKTEDAAQEPKRVATAPANGWGEDIAWRGFDEGMSESAETGRPLMMVVHTTWCTKCKALKKKFRSDMELQELTDDFVMINVDQDENAGALQYAPDGQYIPRIVFLDEAGNVDEKLRNKRSPRYKFFYTPNDDIAEVMRKALKAHGKKT